VKTRGSGSTSLLPLTDAEAAEFIELQAAEFADQKRRAGQWTKDEAMDRSRDAVSQMLQGDFVSRGHRLLKGIDHAGRRVGWIWVGPPPEIFELDRARWLYQITVEPSRRGQGFGRGMLLALEERLAGEGFDALYLNVFKWNRIAIALYDSLGYEVVLESESDAQMRKFLRH